MDCLILTTGHHRDDARLNRHVTTLRNEGVTTTLVAIDTHRMLRLFAAPLLVFRALRTVGPAAVVFPDPELFVPGPLVANWMGIRSVIDIHEDYRAVAMSRDWIPGPLRTVIGRLAAVSVNWGRKLSSATIVAADHLAQPSDVVVPNIPDDGLLPVPSDKDPRMSIVYVGDVTESRGVFEMLEVIKGLPDVSLELIGPITADIESRVREQASVDRTTNRVIITGRLPYKEAWERAAGAIAGLSMLRSTPAYVDAIPSKVWEYMAVGLPIIASDLTAQRDLIEDSGGGVVVGTSSDAATVLQGWLNDLGRWRDIGTQGHTYYRSIADESSASQALADTVTGR